jgi:hypothetical protein
VSSTAELYLYCVRAADHPPPAELAGVGGAAVMQLVRGGLSAWYSVLPRVSPGEEALRAHEMVVREALRTATPVPFRFGTWFAHQEALEELLRREEEQLLALLRRVGGRVEMGIRGIEASAPAGEEGVAAEPATGPGRAYLERRRQALGEGEARARRAERLAAALRDRLDPVAEARTILLPDPTTLFELSLLIGRGEVVAFRERVASVQTPGVELVISGPWAPYSFVAGERIVA